MKKTLLILSILVLSIIISCGSDDESSSSSYYKKESLRTPSIQLRYYDPFVGVERSTSTVVSGQKFFVNVPGESCNQIQIMEISDMGSNLIAQNNQTDQNYECRSYPFIFNPSAKNVKIFAWIATKDGGLKTTEISITKAIPNAYYY